MGNKTTHHHQDNSHLAAQANAQAAAHNAAAARSQADAAKAQAASQERMNAANLQAQSDLAAFQAKQAAERRASQQRQERARQAHQKRMKELENQNKEKQRQRIDAGIKELQSTMTSIDSSVSIAKTELVNVEELRAKYTGEKNHLMKQIDNFDTHKHEQLDNYEIEIKLDIARRDYNRDRNEIENAITKTGVHCDDVGKFLTLTHAMTGATMSTQAEANRLDVALCTMGSIINKECQDKLTVHYYFTEQKQDLAPFVPILKKIGFETLDQMICDNDNEFEKVILTKLDKGIQKQETKQKTEAINKIKEYETEEKQLKERMKEIENELKQLGVELKTEEEENEKQKLIGEQTEINVRIVSYENLLKKQKDILEELEEKAKEREEEKAENDEEEKTDCINDEIFLETDKEGEELCVYLLEKWKLKQYWDKLEEEGWDDADDWATLSLDDLEKEIEISKRGHRNKFVRNAKKWKDMRDKKEEMELQNNNNMENKPKQKYYYYLTTIQQRELKHICLKPDTTWKDYEIEKAVIIKKDLLQLSPIMGEFFGRINEGVKQTMELLNYKTDLSDTQLKAVQMRNENNNKLKAIELRKKDYDGRRILVKNSQCEIYSDSSKQWCKGKIIDVKQDTEGTWLNVEYKINNEIRTKQVQQYNNDIRPLQIIVEQKEEIKNNNNKLDIVKQNANNPIVVESNALITASIVNINVTDTLLKEFLTSPVTERGLTLAVSVEDCCRQTIRNQGEIRQAVFLAQEILKYKPANMNDEKTKQLWNAVDTGIIRIFTSAVEMVKVTAQYFAFFLCFQNSFKFFVTCYRDGQDTTLFTSLERLKTDIREFNKFRENFTETVMQLNKTAMECIGNCVKQQIGHLNWEKTRTSMERTEKIYLAKQKVHNQKALELDDALDKLEEAKVLEISKEARAIEQCKILKSRITQGEAYKKQCRQQMNDLQKIVI